MCVWVGVYIHRCGRKPRGDEQDGRDRHQSPLLLGLIILIVIVVIIFIIFIVVVIIGGNSR